MRDHIIQFKERCQKGKGIGVTKSNVLREFVLTLLASSRVFHKTKVNDFFYFCHI